MSDIPPEKVWHLTQQEISEATGLAQSYIHYIIKCDRKPSPKTALKLEISTGICREAWLWPDRHHNPYIPFYHGYNCLSCINRKNRAMWMVERMIHLTKNASPGGRLCAFFRVIQEARVGMGFPDSLKFVVLAIKPEGFLCLYAAGKPVLSTPYLIPFWLIPRLSEELLQAKVVEMKDVYDDIISNSPMDAAWIAERKIKALLAVSSKRMVLVTSADSDGPTFEWTDESVEAMKLLVNEIDNLLGDELDNPLSQLDDRGRY